MIFKNVIQATAVFNPNSCLQGLDKVNGLVKGRSPFTVKGWA